MKYAEVNLNANEQQKPKAEHGEKIERSGAPIIALPADMKPCPAEWHPLECWCRGTGQIPIRKPTLDALDPVDDSLKALEDAIAAREEAGPIGVDPILGDTPENLMRQSVEVTSGGSGGRSKKSPKGGGAISDSSGRTAIDGRVERTGRPPRFDKTRPASVSAAIAPTVTSALDAVDTDIAALADELLAQPEVRETIAAVKACASPGQ